MRKILLFALLLLLAGAALTLTRTLWLPPRTVTVVLAGQSPYWLPFYVAREEGYFRREGLDVRVVVAADREDLLSALNKEPVVALAEPDVFLSAGEPPVMFARVGRLEPTFLLARIEPKQPFRWSDLQGKSIVGYPPGSEAQAVLETVLKKEGVRAQYQVTVLENIPPALRVPAFLAGTGWYLQAAEPDATLLERQHQAKVTAFPGAVAGDLPAGVFLASRTMVRDRPGDLTAFTRALQRALLWLRHNPAGAAGVGRYFPGLDPSVLAAALERYQTAGVWPDSCVISRDSYQRWVNLMVEGGEMKNPASFDQVVDPLPAQQALQKVQYSPGYKRWIWPVVGN